MPPGPPVLKTLVAEIYGPEATRRMEVASQVKAIFSETPGVVDTDWYVEAPSRKVTLVVNGEKAAAAGLSSSAVASVVRMAGAGAIVGLLHDAQAREDVPIGIRQPRTERSLEAIQSLRLSGARSVAVGELTRVVRAQEEPSLYHKNLQAVTYVTGDLAGQNESPVYAILKMNEAIARLTLPEGYGPDVFNATQPFDTTKYAMKWDGEWHITIEVFRDLGAGIVVRNSIILVDFIELRLRDGVPLAQAVVDAGAVRFRPMALTAAAVYCRRRRDPVRPDPSGPGHFADGRRNGVAPPVAHDRSGSVLHGEALRTPQPRDSGGADRSRAVSRAVLFIAAP